MKLLWILSLALLALVSRLAQVEAQTTCGPRLRKDWDMMTTTEKTTYKNAIAAAMDSGAYIKFVEMHTEMRSEMEAHRQCMFIYWHRLLLLVFENMLRGQGPEYACVTLPYFNWMVASARATSGSCTSFEECSTITRELGGSSSGVQLTLDINGVNTTGRCVDEPPLNHFCQRSSLKGDACAKCIPRGDWTTAQVPASTSYASVRQQLFNGSNIGEMSPLIERGCHNNVHSNLDGAMRTNASTADPIFWSHHTMIDALHTIFHKCRVGTKRMTFAEKAAHPVAWTSCARRDGGIFHPTDVVAVRTGINGTNPIQGSQDPLLAKYFEGIPDQYAGLMDVRDLGNNSYSYMLTGQLATLYTKCDASPHTFDNWTESSATNTTSTSSGNDNVDDGHVDVVMSDVSGNPIDADAWNESWIEDGPGLDMTNWYDGTLSAMGGDSEENMADMERQACMFEHVCLGGVHDYSQEFKTSWDVEEPRCKIIVDAILNGSQPILYDSWREDAEARFGCPRPTNVTNPNSTKF